MVDTGISTIGIKDSKKEIADAEGILRGRPPGAINFERKKSDVSLKLAAIPGKGTWEEEQCQRKQNI